MPAKRKLPPDDVIVAAYRSGMSCREIGERYGCKGNSVHSLLRRAEEPRRSLSEAARIAQDRGRAKGQFPRRNVPWNKGLKGTHFSPDTEFKKGHRRTKRHRVRTVRVWIRRRNGKLHSARAFVKVAQPNVWRLRCHVMWEKAHGPIPKGMLLHYRNGDGMDDRLANFLLVTRAEHLALQRPEFEDRRRARCSKMMRVRWQRYREAKRAMVGAA